MENPREVDAWRHDALGWLPHHEEPELLSTVAPRSTNAIGLDISSYQGSAINWAQVAASGRSFAMLKATEGTDYLSPSLDAQFQGATAAGVRTGLYHFARPDLTPEGNADWFSAQVNRLQAVAGHLPPCLDLETGTGDLNGWAQRFVARLRANTGCVRVLIYSSASYFQSGTISENWMDANIALWVASWGTAPGKPSYGSPRTALHQYSSTGAVSGVAGAVDLDWAVWDLATLIPAAQGSTPVTTPSSSGLNADQAAQLTAAYQQLSGSATVGAWPGWPTWPGGTNESLTLVDLARRANVQLVSLKADLAALKAQAVITPGVSAALSDADVAKIAAAVAGMLAARLQS